MSEVNNNCIFCKIVEKSIPADVVYEDDDYLVFLDIRPISKGHCLVIPKKHFRWVWDVEGIGEYYSVVKKIANVLKEVCSVEMVKSVVMGDEVPHAHIHLIPHYEGTVRNFDFENPINISEEERNKLFLKLKNKLSST